MDSTEGKPSDQLLSEASRKEDVYDWEGAAETYAEVLRADPEGNSHRVAATRERLAYARFKSAFQADTSDLFTERTEEAVAKYTDARESYREEGAPDCEARTARCDAMLELLGYWTTSGAADKKKRIEETWRLARLALDAFSAIGDGLEFARTYDDLVFSAGILLHMLSDPKAMTQIHSDAVAYGEKAIGSLSAAEHRRLLAAVQAITSCLIDQYRDIADSGKRQDQKVSAYWLGAKELSEEDALVSIARCSPMMSAWYATPKWLLDSQGGPSALEAVLPAATRTRDRLIIGSAYDLLGQDMGFRPFATEDPEERRIAADASLELSREAKRQYSVISFVTPRVGINWAEKPEVYGLTGLGVMETDRGRKTQLLTDGLEFARELMQKAETSGYPRAVAIGHLHMNIIPTELARSEEDPQVRKELLVEALPHGDAMVGYHEHFFPFFASMYGPGVHYRAITKYELQKLEDDPEVRRKLLQESVEDQRKGIELTIKYGLLETIASTRYGQYHMDLGDSLRELHAMTWKPEYLRESVSSYFDAVRFFKTSDAPSRIAECYWRAGLAWDGLGEHAEAAESFASASEQYMLAARRMPRLRQFFDDHARYMEAWAEIELAWGHHRRQESIPSAEHFEKAAELHRSTKRWAHLAPTYSAWACIERAEDLSCKGENAESIKLFEEAANHFGECEASLKAQPAGQGDAAEDGTGANLIEATEIRKVYCSARVLVEEARVLEKQGDMSSSYDRYRAAINSLEDLVGRMPSEQCRDEVLLVLNLARAWQLMVKAEEESSPEMYAKASELFEEVKDLSPALKTKSLALGHSRFCKALEAGTRFADTGDADLHAVAVRHLESASKHYLKAGHGKVAEYANACRLLFDGYVYMGKATEEESQEQRARLYAMAEKVLEAAAASYKKADQPAKEEQICRLLEKVRGDKAIALTLTQMFRAPDMAIASAAFPGPTLTHETAASLDKFAHADVQATVIGRPKELHVGDDFCLEVELANAGRGAAQLMKVEEVVMRGFDIRAEPEKYRVEGSYVNMKGRRLDPLKTEDFKVVLRPTAHGRFTFRPRVMYLDDVGKYRSCEPEPVEVTVRELGISGWLKGPGRREQ